MKPKLTLKQIAKELDVSISTVSKSLRDSTEIGVETRKKVKAFAKLYNYKPNNIALSLRYSRTHTIGIIIPEVVHHFFSTVIKGVEKVANARGYQVIVCLSNNSFEKEVMNIDLLAGGSTDGFILSVAKETQQKKDYHHLQAVVDQGLPLVLFDRIVNEIACDKVIIDDVEGAKNAVLHLLKTGCRKIAMLTTVDYVSVGKLRTKGYIEALKQEKIEVDDDLILKIEDVDNSDSEIMDFLNKNEVDGIFAVNEQFSASAVKCLVQKGLKVPDDVQVIAFTDGELSKKFIPSLTTVNQHGAEIGEKAAQMLIDRLELPAGQQEPFVTEVIKTSLIERDSTKQNSLAHI